MTDDPTLLRRFAAQRCQTSFTELVHRHLGLVYHSALRVTDGDTQLAEDAAQATFLLAAEKAATLCEHPELAGWLYTTACHKARELRRSEERRHRREQTATTMNELHGEPTNDEAWSRVRPVIDDALLELTPEDRTAVVLRFFEGRAFAEIGAALRVGENAARMRVERALERLQGALARRGITSTAAMLATALAVPASLAAPAGLAGKIGAAAAAGAAAGGAAGSTAFLHFMTSSKIIAAGAGVAAAVALGTAVHFHQQRAATQAELVQLRGQHTELQRRLADAEQRLTAHPVRPDQQGVDQGASAAAAASRSSGPDENLTRNAVMDRYRQALELLREGKWDAGLAELLWCYDVGMVRIADLSRVRNGALLNQLVELGDKHPPALAALQARRDACEGRVLASNSSLTAVLDYAALNEALGDGDKTLVVYDSMAASDERKAVLGRTLLDQLLEARRYGELAEMSPSGMAVAVFEASARGGPAARGSRQACATAAKNLEALAGAGDLAGARQLLDKVLAFDNAPETRALLAKHLARAGHPELLAP